MALKPDTEAGIAAVRARTDGKYVFIMEKYMGEYYANRKPCNIRTVGPLIGKRAFGMAVPQTMDRELSEGLHAAILEMMEEGRIGGLDFPLMGGGDPRTQQF